MPFDDLTTDRGVAKTRRQRRLVRAAAGLIALLAMTAAAIAVVEFGPPWWMGESDHNHVYTSEDGSLRYQVHVPPRRDAETPLPVMMALHGCGMTGYGVNSMKSATQFNSLADQEGFIVVYPTQRLFENKLNCWNSADPREQLRYTGEPALLAGVARQVVEDYTGDPRQVHVVGASSGAGTAVILAATYPDVFASATSVAGGEYGLNQVDPDHPETTPTDYTAGQAWAQMGSRARRVPLMIVQGAEDEVVPPIVASRLTDQWSAIAELVDDGLLNGSLRLVARTTTVPGGPGAHEYAHTSIRTPDGQTVVDSYVVQGMGHDWPGPRAEGFFVDRAGPDASAMIWDFARRHPMPATS